MSKLFQIYEDDLAELERMLPDLSNRLAMHLTPRLRTQLGRVQTILSNVRWDYGPKTHVGRIECDADDDDQPTL